MTRPTTRRRPTGDGPEPTEPPRPSPHRSVSSARRSRRDRRRRRRPTRRRGRLLLVLGLLALPFVVAAGWFWYQLDPIGDPGAPVAVTIPKGEGVSGIGDRLEQPRGDRLVARVLGLRPALAAPQRFQAGRYRLRRGPRGAQRGRRARAGSEPALHDAGAAARAHVRARSRRASARCRAASAARATELATTGHGAVEVRAGRARTRSKGSPGPTRTRSRTTRPRPTSSGRSSRAFDRHATAAGLAGVARSVPDGDRRVADPARGRASTRTAR